MEPKGLIYLILIIFIISQRGDVWIQKTSLTPPLFIEVPVPNLESEWGCLCEKGISILLLFTIFLLEHGTLPTMWYFLFSLVCASYKM